MALERRVERVKALVINQANSNTDKFVLGEETSESILAYVNEYSYINDFGTNVSISALTAPNQGSIVVLKQPNLELKDKTNITNPYSDADKTELDTVSIGWQNPRFVMTTTTAYENDRGLQATAASFIAKAVEAGAQTRQILGFTDLITEDTKKASNTLSAAVLSDAKQFRDRILTEASNHLKTVNDIQGIRGIKIEDIVIHVSAEQAFKLIEVVGNQAMEQFENGLYKTLRIGGFSLRVNDILARVPTAPKVIISTNFAYKSFHAIKGAKVELLPGTFDNVKFYEDAIAQGVVYSGITKVLY